MEKNLSDLDIVAVEVEKDKFVPSKPWCVIAKRRAVYGYVISRFRTKHMAKNARVVWARNLVVES